MHRWIACIRTRCTSTIGNSGITREGTSGRETRIGNRRNTTTRHARLKKRKRNKQR